MNKTYRLAWSSVCLFGIILVSNAINEIETHYALAAAIVVWYQIALIFVGNFARMITRRFSCINQSTDDKVEEKVEELSFDEFEIADINFNNSKVIGTFRDSNIYDSVTVVFDNGYEAIYNFYATIKVQNLEALDPSELTPGALIVSPGIIYVPAQ